MNILIVCDHFGLSSRAGATRNYRAAKYLTRRGHRVFILSKNAIGPFRENDEDVADRPGSGKLRRFIPTPFLTIVLTIADNLVFPDLSFLWGLRVTLRHRSLLSDWIPDVVLASANPISTFIIARAVSKSFSIPWIAEYRDLWSENPYRTILNIRRKLDWRFEKRLLGTAAAITTVSVPLREDLLAFGLSVSVIENGFDPDDYADVIEIPSAGTDQIRIVYTGTLYPNKRDPSLLFSAISSMDPEWRSRLRIEFFGRNTLVLKRLIKKYQAEDYTILGGMLSTRKAIAEQIRADVNLLLVWNDPRSEGTYTAKFFEYLGARRPVLMIGNAEGVAGSYIRNNRCGICAETENDIMQFLKNLDIYRRRCHESETYRQFSAANLSGKLELLLSQVVEAARNE